MREPLREFLEQRSQGDTVGLLVGQLPNRLIQCGRECGVSLREVTGERGRLMVQLILQLTVGLFTLRSQLSSRLLEHAGQCLQFRGQVAHGIGALLFLSLQLPRNGLDFVSYVLVQRGKSIFQISAQLGRLREQLGLKFGKPAFVIPYLRAEEDIADLVEVVAGGMFFGQRGICFCRGKRVRCAF